MRWTERQRAMLHEMGIVTSWMRDDDVRPDEVATPAPSRAPLKVEEASLTAMATLSATEGAPAVEVASRHESSPPAGVASAASAEGTDWLVVGDPLDAVADDGDAERLLDNMLRAIGVSRDAAGRSMRARYVAVSAGVPADLDASIASASPRCLLVFGRAAAQALLGLDEPLGCLRGKVHRREGRPVVVTFAPTYLLRHSEDKAKAWADLCLAVREAGEAQAG